MMAATVVQVLHGLFYGVLLQQVVVAEIIFIAINFFNFYFIFKFYCRFYCSCDPSFTALALWRQRQRYTTKCSSSYAVGLTYCIVLLLITTIWDETEKNTDKGKKVTLKVKGYYRRIKPSTITRLWAMGRHLPYGITQCCLPPDTS